MKIVFEKRKTISRKAIFLVPLVSFLISLLLTAILLLIFKANPLTTYAAMFQGAFGSWMNFTETLVKATPLMLTGLGVLIAFRLKFWNIGAEGQLTFGGIAAAWIALFWSPFLPDWTVLPFAIIAGMLAGALWAGIQPGKGLRKFSKSALSGCRLSLCSNLAKYGTLHHF